MTAARSPVVMRFKGVAPKRAARGRPAAKPAHAAQPFAWAGVRRESYKLSGADGAWADVARHVLVGGSRGAPLQFDLRYFEIAAGGYTQLEQHRHAHVVLVLRGRGQLRIGRRWQQLDELDACYIAPERPHQLRNVENEPFGFLCIVDAKRDAGRAIGSRRKIKKATRSGSPSPV